MSDEVLTIETPVDAYVWNNDLEILKHKLKTLLKDNIVEVSFTKADGTLREMKCTLKNTIIPQAYWEKNLPDTGGYVVPEKRTHTVPENVLPVWDVEKNAFRSFRIDRVHDYIVLKNEK